METWFRRSAMAGSLLGLALLGAGAARAAVVIDWFHDPTGLLPYGNGDEFVAYSTGSSGTTSSFISLDWTDYSKHTIIASSTGGTYDTGSPLATLTSTNAGDLATNSLTAFTFVPGPDLPFNHFNGVYFLSTIDSTSPTTTVTVTVDYHNFKTDSDGAESHVFIVDTPDVGRIGFGPDYSLSDHYDVTSVTFALRTGEAAWNQIDDLVFSVPEASTWAMLLLGFSGLGLFASRGARRSA